MNHKRGAFLSRDLVANTEAVELLCRIRKWISATGPACLVHPLGFCVVLLQKNDDEEWRFHVWPKGARRITGMPALIHTHNKVVESKILRGELSNIIYSVAGVAKGGAPVYEVEYLGDRYAFGLSECAGSQRFSCEANRGFKAIDPSKPELRDSRARLPSN
jgi:hypothetical protein